MGESLLIGSVRRPSTLRLTSWSNLLTYFGQLLRSENPFFGGCAIYFAESAEANRTEQERRDFGHAVFCFLGGFSVVSACLRLSPPGSACIFRILGQKRGKHEGESISTAVRLKLLMYRIERSTNFPAIHDSISNYHTNAWSIVTDGPFNTCYGINSSI